MNKRINVMEEEKDRVEYDNEGQRRKARDWEEHRSKFDFKKKNILYTSGSRFPDTQKLLQKTRKQIKVRMHPGS